MTEIYGTIKNVANQLSYGFVIISSVMTRPLTGGEQIVTRELYRSRIIEGKFSAPDLIPGPAVVELNTEGVYERFEIIIPESGRHALGELVEKSTEWSPEVVSRVEAAASKALEASAVAERVLKSLGGAETITAAQKKVEQLESQARQAAADAAGAEKSVATSLGKITSAEQSVLSAAQRAEAAAASSVDAQRGVDAARQEITTVHGDVVAQAAVVKAAVGVAGQVKADAESADQARVAAESAAQRASEAAENAHTGAPAGGWKLADLAEEVKSQIGKAPDASSSAKGVVKLAGDLAGTADYPTVPGLAGKADTTQVEALARRVEGLPKITVNDVANNVVQRDSGAQIYVPQVPVNDKHAVSKKYVDSVIPTGVVEPTASTLVRRGDNGTISAANPLTAQNVVTKQYFDAAIKDLAGTSFSAKQLELMKRRSGILLEGYSTNVSNNWGPCQINLTPNPLQPTYSGNLGDLIVPLDGQYIVKVVGQRGGSSGKLAVYHASARGTSTEVFSWNETSAVSKEAVIESRSGYQIGMWWNGNPGRNFSYTVTVELVK